jgi:hypothetical protein
MFDTGRFTQTAAGCCHMATQVAHKPEEKLYVSHWRHKKSELCAPEQGLAADEFSAKRS